MTNPIELNIKVQADAADAARSFDAAGDAAARMGADVKDAGADAQAAASKLDRVGGAAEGLDDKGGRATGAMGALASGLSLLGPQGQAAGAALETAAMATDGLSGVGQALNLVMDLQIVKTISAKAATVGKTVADKAATVATKAMAAGQWLLNAALSANPIGLVVLAVVALVALLVVLYKKNDKVRSIIQAVGRVGKQAIGAVVAIVGKLVGWVKDKIPPAFDKAKAIVVGMVKVATFQIRLIIAAVKLVAERGPELIRALKDRAAALFGAIKDKAVAIWRGIKETISSAIGNAKDAVGNAKTAIVGFFGDLLAPIQTVIDKIDAFIRKVREALSFDIPNPFGKGIAGLNPLARGTGMGAAGATYVTQNITITGAVDPLATARTIEGLSYRAARITGAVA